MPNTSTSTRTRTHDSWVEAIEIYEKEEKRQSDEKIQVQNAIYVLGRLTMKAINTFVIHTMLHNTYTHRSDNNY